ncbi:FAD-dependent oxidoreductase [Kitasatospora sp. MAP5-34]|uniref:FAD-dependent oxidoreductase n=1 Tax=Kitasatospora sp. MAP5-34 TaxID=3035102 RepID=UPI0024769054|nr:FAD-dependent oxidoreductase [Kitasatospora sp. MAP5-34]MDH6575016.1 sarcosine oxidase [Kitasatospora sp. MAP5-34]
MTGTAVVVGAGVFGLSVGRELAGRGWSVRIVDPNPPGTQGPSAAESRILRFSHGHDSRYPRMVRRARAMWRALELESGRQFVLPVGVLVLGPPHPDDGEWEHASAARLRQLDIPVETVPAEAVGRRFPGFDGRGSGTVLFEPEGAVLRAKEAVLALAESAADRGAELLQATALPVAGRAVVNGEPLAADVTVWAVGPGLPGLFPGLTTVRAVRQDSWYVQPTGPWAAATGQPAWLDRAHGYYGVPAVGSLGVKVVPDVETPPDAATELPPEGLPEPVRAYLGARLPDLAHAPALRRESCSYALTDDEHFLLAPHPQHPGTWFVGGDSGHGFKHGPAWGAYACDVIEGRTGASPRLTLR